MSPLKHVTEHRCSNCGENVRIDRALTVQQNGRVLAMFCENCQKATKLQVTLKRQKGEKEWEYYQFFPLEA